MKKKKISEGDTATCPHCGRTGLINEICADGTMIVVHKVSKGHAESQATGAMIECSIVEDMCWRGFEEIRGGVRRKVS